MDTLYGRNWTRAELVRHIGHMDQVAGIRLLVAGDGGARGNRVLEVWTGTGLFFLVQADRALDISVCRYKGIPLAWASAVGETHPAHYEPAGLGWLRSFAGGLLATCGLDHFGAPSRDGADELGLHGRISNLPARSLGYRARWIGEEYSLEIAGEMRQSTLFGENLVLRRRISTHLGSSRIRLEDEVVNEGFKPQPHMILYHFNMGFPLVCEESRLRLDTETTAPRDAHAEQGLVEWRCLQRPTADYVEQVYHHVPMADAEGLVHVELENPALGVGVRWTYEKRNLPHLFQWKMMGEGEYALGIEPANSSGIDGRASARELGDLPVLAPGESRRYVIDFEVIESPRS